MQGDYSAVSSSIRGRRFWSLVLWLLSFWLFGWFAVVGVGGLLGWLGGLLVSCLSWLRCRAAVVTASLLGVLLVRLQANVLHGDHVTEELIGTLLPGAQLAAVGEGIVSEDQVDEF